MLVTILTLAHVAISLVGIFSGLVVLFGLLTDKRLDGWTALFLATTVLRIHWNRTSCLVGLRNWDWIWGNLGLQYGRGKLPNGLKKTERAAFIAALMAHLAFLSTDSGTMVRRITLRCMKPSWNKPTSMSYENKNQSENIQQ